MAAYYDDEPYYPPASPQPPKPSASEAFLGDDNAPPALKRLFTEVLPARDLAAFCQMVRDGDFDAAITCDAHPFAGVLPQLLTLKTEELSQWLRPLLQRREIDTAALELVYYYNGNSYSTAIDSYRGQSQQKVALASWLMSNRSMKIYDLAALDVRLLAQNTQIDGMLQPLVMQMFSSGDCNWQGLQKLADAAGSDDFLHYRNARGETLFYKLCLHRNYFENPPTLEALSWMLDRAPELVNATDDAGWTVLDRHVMLLTRYDNLGRGTMAETALTRLLLSAGAELKRQSAPGFNLASELEKREPNKPILKAPRL